MPWVTINLMEGRDRTTKEKLHTAVAAAVAESLGLPIDRVRVQLVEMDSEDHSIGGRMVE